MKYIIFNEFNVFWAKTNQTIIEVGDEVLKTTAPKPTLEDLKHLKEI